jgi:hypothetical protein
MSDTTPAAAAAPTIAPLEVPAHVLAGLPEDFTLEQLRETHSDEEIRALASGDDPIITLPGNEPPPATTAADAPPAAVVPPVEDQPPPAQAAPVTPPPSVPMPQKPDTTAMKADVDALEQQITALTTKFDDGDLTLAEFAAQQRELVQQQEAIKAEAQRQTAIYQGQMNEVQTAWWGHIDAYKAQHPDLWSPELVQGWDVALKSITNNPAYLNVPMPEKIAMAHAQFAVAHKATTGKDLPTQPGNTPAAKAATEQKQDGPRQDPRPAAPVTLAGLTSAEANGTANTVFGHIDALIDQGRVSEAEAAVAALSEVDRQRFLEMQ